MSNRPNYSISCGQPYDGASACIWRNSNNSVKKIARFQTKADALQFAAEFGWPLSDLTKAALQEPKG